MAAKRVSVRFGSGHDVLNAYWGFLGDGGLMISAQDDLGEGESVSLDIHIDSLETDYELNGHVVRSKPSGGKAAIAFEPGEPQDLLLSAAIAEADAVPARGTRRYEVDEPVYLRAGGRDAVARMVNVSETGCCLRLDAVGRDVFPPGCSEFEIQGPHFTAAGTVVWANVSERGVHFKPSPELSGRIQDWVGKRRTGTVAGDPGDR